MKFLDNGFFIKYVFTRLFSIIIWFLDPQQNENCHLMNIDIAPYAVNTLWTSLDKNDFSKY